MTCSRCHGFMVKDHFLDSQGQFREMWATSWRCRVLVHERTEPDYEEDDTYLGGEAFVRRAA